MISDKLSEQKFDIKKNLQDKIRTFFIKKKSFKMDPQLVNSTLI